MRKSLAAAAAVLWAVVSLSAADQPNVVLILADDMSWVGTSVQMDPDRPDSRSDYHQTPALERLAREGMRFSDAYSPHPNCSPTRLAIQTGKTPAQLNMSDIINRNRGAFYEGLPMIPPQHIDHIPHEERTIAELIKEHRQGYVTAHFGKWHLAGGGPGKHGYDEHSGTTSNAEGRAPEPDPKRTVSVTTRAVDFLRHRKTANEPFFLQVSYYAVHLGIFAFEETVEKFESRPKGGRHKHAGHAAMTHELDVGVGRILEALDRLELAEDTYVIFTSDNGSYLDAGDERVSSNAPLKGQKASTWEGGIRVPLLVRGPGIEAGSTSRAVVTGTDLFPTVASMVGIRAELSPLVEGGDLFGLLQAGGKGRVSRRFNTLVWHFPHYQTQKGTTPMSSIRAGRWKMVREYESGKDHLFDLSEDLGESTDVLAENEGVAKRLARQLERYLTAVDAPMARRRAQ